MSYRILLTCPPMIGMVEEFRPLFEQKGHTLVVPDFLQVMSEDALASLLPEMDGWIIGDDPATRRVLEAGEAGRLKACVRWGVGVDNVDFDACRDLGIPIQNTPGVFGREVADIALTYVLGLARESFRVDREIRLDKTWPKPPGISTWGKRAGIVGYGDIGRQTARRLEALDMDIIVFDPAFEPQNSPVTVTSRSWAEDRLDDLDFLIFTAPLNKATYHMFNQSTLPRLKPGVRVINVGRGPIIEQSALIAGLDVGLVHSAALDVFETEPLSNANPLRRFDQCIFGSHNGSNTVDAVRHVSRLATDLLLGFLDGETA